VANEGFVDASAPRALQLDETPWHYSSTRAIEAGFDRVQLHGAHANLLDAFLRDGSKPSQSRAAAPRGR
jgi:N-ethylmaleimide reductase